MSTAELLAPSAPGGVSSRAELPLLDRADRAWIGRVIDRLEGCAGAPWRVLLERLEQDPPPDVHPSRVALVVRALRRVTGDGSRRRIARRCRALVLGDPVLDRAARDHRLVAAACALSVTPAELERDLWADLAMERAIVLPRGRPDELAVAAYANLDRIQRAVRRATGLRVSLEGDAHELVRTIARSGLLAHVRRGNAEGSETVLDIAGPLSVFGATGVYGRVLAGLVPQLVARDRFTLDLRTERDGQLGVLRIEPPVLVPAAPAIRRRPSLAERLVAELVGAGIAAVLDPEPLETASGILYPELRIDVAPHPCYVEIIGFATAASIRRSYGSRVGEAVKCARLASMHST